MTCACSSGVGPVWYLPWGASASWLVTVTKVEDGSRVDLTGATVDLLLKSSPTIPDADAELALAVGSGLTIVDALAGLFVASVTAAQSEALDIWREYTRRVKITLPGGQVLIPDQLRGAVVLNDDAACAQSEAGESVVRLDATTGAITPVTPDMSNYVLNRYDLTGLTGGTAVKLDGLAATVLAPWADGTMVRLFFTGSIAVDYRLRANTGAETESSPWRILCDNAATRLWELVAIHKEGVSCLWDPALSKFRQQIITDGVPTVADAAQAFSLPT